ncbi:acyl-CoA thioesterase [bacterium]|nr:acyl-CoA thioesterase [bacterium]
MNKITGEPFHTQIRVRYSEIDKLGIAHNSHYLTWFEVARTELLRSYDLTYNELEKTGFHFPLVEAGVKYMKPVLYDDVLTVVSSVMHKPGVRVRIDYKIHKDGEIVATGFTEHAFVDDNLRPMRPPKNVRDKLLIVWDHSTGAQKRE